MVLVHGFGEDDRVWQYLVEQLKQRYRLIVPALPGCNGSAPLPAGKEYALTDFAALLQALLEQEGITACTLLGHSMGGYITLALAQQYPSLVNAFGLVHSSAYADTAEKKETRQKNIAFIAENGSAAFLKATGPNLFGEHFKQQHAAEMQQFLERGKTLDATSLQAYTAAMMNRPDTTQVLSGSKVPVLFILGTEDKAVPLKDALRQTHLPATSFIHILEGVGHMGMLEAKEKVTAWVDAFMTTTES